MSDSELFIPEPIRAQLVKVGIPRAEHVPDVLASLFPDEYNIRATGLNAADLARVLVYLVDKRIVSLPGSPAPIPVKQVTPGWHSCHFYRDFNQLLDIIAPYIAEGLKNGEACLWVTPKAVTKDLASHMLAHHVESVDAAFASGQLEIISHPDWYLDRAGQLKSFEEIAQALLAKQDAALARGFKFLRAAGDTGWVSGTEESKDFIDYEMKVNAALKATKVAAVCTYRADVTAEELVAIVTAHQDALFKGPVC